MTCFRIVFLAALLAVAPVAMAQEFYYSVDLGSDLDRSDPTTTNNNFMDCGAVYKEAVPLLIKDDDGLDVAVYPGTPFDSFSMAPQPQPQFIGYDPTAPAVNVRIEYGVYFDLDGEDQLGMELAQHEDPVLNQYLSTDRTYLGSQGLVFEPNGIFYSYDDDDQAGWYKSGLIPTNSGPTTPYGNTTAMNEVIRADGPFAQWVETTGVRTETMLGLPLDPMAGSQSYDDDVDALDLEEHQYFYFSADHEAHRTLDPGSIYLCDLYQGAPNNTKIYDDVLHIGVTQDTDVDAFEFALISDTTYNQLFEGVANADVPLAGLDVMVLLFSVDANDIDNDGIIDDWGGDESGGLLPNALYMSNLAGEYVLLSTYAADIDALTVSPIPEPSTFALATLGLLGLAFYGWRRKR